MPGARKNRPAEGGGRDSVSRTIEKQATEAISSAHEAIQRADEVLRYARQVHEESKRVRERFFDSPEKRKK
jgi:hypothetical protein